jgi:WD40 repeat protein
VILRASQESLTDAIFSPDEREIATASYDGTARIWSKSTRDEPLVLNGDIQWEAHFSPDGKRIAAPTRLGAAKDGNTALVWSVDGSGEPVVLRGHQDSVYTANFSPDGSKVVTGSFDGTARVWASDGAGSPIVLPGHGGPVFIARFSPDGKHIITVTSRVQRGEYTYPGDGILRVWRSDGAGAPLVLKGHRGDINSATFSPDSERILTAGQDGTLRVWPVDGATAPIMLRPHRFDAQQAEFDFSGKRVVSVSGDKTAMIQNADGSGEPIVWSGPSILKNAQFSPDGKRVLLRAENSNDVYLWNADGRTEPQVLHGHTRSVNSARFSSDGKYIVTTSYDGSARIWLADGTGEALVLGAEVGNTVYWAELSPDNSRALTISSPQAITRVMGRVWTVGWNHLVHDLRARTGECLTSEQRIKYLNETPQAAEDHSTECERKFGRQPAQP